MTSSRWRRAWRCSSTLHKSDQQFVAPTPTWPPLTNSFHQLRPGTGNGARDIDNLLTTAREVYRRQRPGAEQYINNLAEVTNAIRSRKLRNAGETVPYRVPGT